MDSDPVDLIASEITPDERLLWSGRPNGGIILSSRDYFSILVGTLMIVVGLSFIASYEEVRQSPMVLLYVFMAIAGLITLGRPLLHDPSRRRRMAYALTSRRIIILSAAGDSVVRSIQLSELGDISLTEGNDGSGIIDLGLPEPRSRKMQLGSPTWNTIQNIRSLALASDARRVYQLIRTAQAESASQS